MTGAGSWTSPTEAGIVDRNGRGLGVVAADLDADGRVDLFVANDSSANFLFRNLGGMRSRRPPTPPAWPAMLRGTTRPAWGSPRGTSTAMGSSTWPSPTSTASRRRIYRNLGGGVFIDATAASGLAVASRRLLGFGVAFLDANDDGRLDLASANGHVNDLRPNYPYRMPAQLLVGGADGRLTDVSDVAGAPWRVPRMGRGLVVGDLDNDGRQDVLILSHNQPLAYFHNRTEGGRSLTLRLEGRGSNRDAIGARVAVVAGGRRLVAWRTGGGSYQSAGDPRLHFGLGDAPGAESVEVTWPSGHVEPTRACVPVQATSSAKGGASPSPWKGSRPAGGAARPDRSIRARTQTPGRSAVDPRKRGRGPMPSGSWGTLFGRPASADEDRSIHRPFAVDFRASPNSRHQDLDAASIMMDNVSIMEDTASDLNQSHRRARARAARRASSLARRARREERREPFDDLAHRAR